MRYLAMLVGVGLLGWLGFTHFVPSKTESAPPPPPPPPPAILAEPPPMVLDEESLQRVRTATQDTDATVRWEAVQFLLSARDSQADEIVYGMLHRDSDAGIRKNIIGLLARQRAKGAVEEIVQRLGDTDSGVRLACLDALVLIGDYTASEPISALMHDSDETVRLRAIKALNDLQNKRTAEMTAAKAEHETKMKAWEEQVRQQQAAEKK